ncbi:MAG TPA: hypothetical protein VGJ03_00810 [Acidimicrobiales bacterium]|jgi:hypothetical protein
MTQWGYVTVGYVLVFVVLAVYAVRTLLKGRALSKQVPPESRRWM